MPGESAGKLWKANEWAFKSTKKHMEQGKDSTEDLIEMIRRLQRKAPVADGGKDAEEKYLKYDGQKSWKIRAVSLIHFMLCHYRDTNSVVVDEAFKACSEAWPLMDFVESSDTKANLASLAADKEFNTLENIWKKKLKVKPTQSDGKLTIRNRMIQNIKFKLKPSQSDSKLTMIQDIKSRISEGEKDAKGDHSQDSMETMMAAANSSLYKTSGVIESKAINLSSANAIHTLGSLVASVIVDCLANELKNALTEKCSKWAVEGEEQKIYHAAYIAGKAMAMGASDLFQTSQGNNEVPEGDVEEGEGNNACGGGVAPDGQENNSCGILEAVDTMHEDLQEAEDDAESAGDNNC